MNTGKDKKYEMPKNENKKMPVANQSEKLDQEKLKQNQDPSSFSHKQSKEETYEPKRTEMPKEETYEPKKTEVPKGNPIDDQRI